MSHRSQHYQSVNEVPRCHRDGPLSAYISFRAHETTAPRFPRVRVRALVLGAGLQGSACAYDLLTRSEARVTLADFAPGPLPAFLEPLRSDRLDVVPLDVRQASAVRDVMRDHEVALSAVPYYYNYDLTRLAVDAGIHFADLGGNTDTVRRQEQLTSAAAAEGISVIPDCGVAPGMINILAVEAMSRLSEVDAVRLYAGGLPRHPRPPLNYAVVYSLHGVLDYYTTPSWVLEGGRAIRIPALSEIERVELRKPLGSLDAFHTAGGLSTMPWKLEGRVESLEYKTLRYPGHAAIMRAIRDLGLLDEEAIEVEGQSVRPRDVFIAAAGPKLRSEDPEDVVAVKVIAEGVSSGERRRVVLSMVDVFDTATGISAMMRTTGYSLSITGQMQVSGQVGPPGVRAAYEAVPYRPYVDALRARGILVEEEQTGG